jgi:hypothetical protein
MKTLAHQRLDVLNQTRSNPALRDWRGQFTLDSKPIEFEGFGNCGEFATIRGHAATSLVGFIPVEFHGFGIRAGARLGFNSPEFEGIGNTPN